MAKMPSRSISVDTLPHKDVEPQIAKELNPVIGHPDPLVANRREAPLSNPDMFSKALVEVVSTSTLTPALRRKAYRKNNGEPGSKSIADEANGYTLLEVAEPHYNLDKLAKLAETNWANGAAIKAKTSNIVGFGHELVVKPSLQFKIDQKKDSARENAIKKANAARFDVEEWLQKISKDVPFDEVLNRVWHDYEATGNGYIEIGRQQNGQIGYLGHIPATTMRVRKVRDGFVQLSRSKAQFFRNFGDTKTADPIGGDPRPNEVIHIFKYSPTSGYYGIPDIVGALTAATGNKFAEEYNLEYFENKAVPRYIIKTKGPELSYTAQTKIMEFFTTNLKGTNHRTVYIPLPPDTEQSKNDFEIVPVETSKQDSSFENYMRVNLSIILMAHGVPHTKVFSAAETATLAVAKDFDKTFKEQKCRPEQRLLNFYIGRVVASFTDVFDFKLKEFSLSDEDTQSQIDDREIKVDVVTANEVRARKGLAPLPDGDKTYSEKQAEVAKASKTDPTAQPRAEAKAQAAGSRTRDSARSAGRTDSAGRARNPQGEGRSVS